MSSPNRGVVPHPTRNLNRPSSPTVVRQPSTTFRGAPSPSSSFPNASIEHVPHRPSRQKSSFTSIAPHDSASASTFVTPISPRPTRSSPVQASTNVTVTRGVVASPPDCVGVGRRPSSRAPSSRARRARRHLHRCAADDDHRAGRRHARRGLTSSPASPREFEFVTNDNRPTKTARRSALVASARRRSIAKDTDDACDRAW